MKLSEILSGPETWCQGAHQKGEQRCLEGALFDIAPEERRAVTSLREMRRLARAIVEVSDPHFFATIAQWNDAPERTWDDIAAVVEAYDRDPMLNP